MRSAKDFEISKMDVVMEPHSIQATSILRMLGCDLVGTVEVSDTEAQVGDGLKVVGVSQQVAEHVFQHSEHLYDARVCGRRRFVPLVWKNDAGEWQLSMAEFLSNGCPSEALPDAQGCVLQFEGTCLFKGEDLNSTWTSSDERTCKVHHFPNEERMLRRQLLQIHLPWLLRDDSCAHWLPCSVCVCYSNYLCLRDHKDFSRSF